MSGMQDNQAKQQARNRQVFEHNGQKVYEWDQTLEDVNIYIQPPKFLLKKYEAETRKQLLPGQSIPKLDILITSTHLKIGIKGNPPFVDEDLSGLCDASESLWCIEDEELHIILQKGHRGEVWASALKNHSTLNPVVQAEVQKKLLLERFQQENPGFDFSGADFNGQAPDPRTFMGGVKYER